MTYRITLEFSEAQRQVITAKMHDRGWQNLRDFVQNVTNETLFGQGIARGERSNPIMSMYEYEVLSVLSHKPTTTNNLAHQTGKWASNVVQTIRRLESRGLITCTKETYTGGRPAKIWAPTEAGLSEVAAESERREKLSQKTKQLAQLRMADSAAASRAQQAPKQKTVREQFAKVPDFVLPEAHTYFHTWVEKYFNKFPQATFDQALAAFFSRYTPIKGHIEWSAECNMNDMSWEYATEDLVKNGWEYDIEGKTLDPLPADAPGPVKEFDLDQELSMSALEKFAEGRK